MSFGIRIFDRYIWRQVFGSTLTGVIVLTGVMVLGNVFKEMERLLGDTSSLPLTAVVEFIGYVIPYSLIFTIPWAPACPCGASARRSSCWPSCSA
jgi:lipopolysaccharide export LptBFGC system permease protein LptF